MRRRWLVVLVAVAGLTPSRAQAQDPADAYVDEAARELLRLARLRRTLVDRRIEAYSTTARERMSVRLRAETGDASRIAPSFERLFYRRQTVTRIEWKRDGPIGLEVLGARVDAPLFGTRPQVNVPSRGLNHHRLAYDPVDPDALLLFDSTVVRHPLAEGSESHYRFATGDTTVLRLPDGGIVRVRELRIIPRRRDPQLINGSFWLDADTHALVQAYFKLARAYDADLDDVSTLASLAQFIGVTSDDGRPPGNTGERMPGFVKPIRVELDFVAIDYGLWEKFWWLPRRVVWRGMLQAGRITFPVSYERTYDEYTVRGDTSSVFVARSDSLRASCRPRVRFRTSLAPDAPFDSLRQARVDSARARQDRFEALLAKRRAEWGGSVIVQPECEHDVIMAAAPDSVLMSSPELAATAYAGDLQLISEQELRDIIGRVRSIPDPPCCSPGPRFQWGLQAPGLVRYNRIEGFSAGAQLRHELSASTSLVTEARLGLADLEPRGEISLAHRGDIVLSRLAAYRRLMSVTQSAASHGTLASLGALLLSRDDDDYFDALGAEVVLRPTDLRPQWYQLRLYAERQRVVERNTDFSIAHLIDSDRTFPQNFAASAADQFGARLRLRSRVGDNPAGCSAGGELSLTGEVGTYEFLRAEALVRGRTPLLYGFLLGLEGAIGTVESKNVPTQQALWRIGGASTLRGFASSALIGERYWRARGEVGRDLYGYRLTVFSDAAWAGARTSFGSAGALYSAGVGVGLWDGLLRVDLARGLRSGNGWRVHVQFNGAL